MGDRPLDKAVILDTEEDIATRIAIVCNSCGTELSVTEINEEPERAVVLEVGVCERCSDERFQHGYYEGLDQHQSGGY